VNHVYFCEQTENLELSRNDSVHEVRGEHFENHQNSDVRGLRVYEKKLHYFPRGIDRHFGNLQFLAIWTTGLKEIHSEDLAPFTKLTVLSIWDNEIEMLERDLLKTNTELEYIGLGKNRIKFVDGKVFNHLTKLHTLHFDNNDCVSRQVAGDKQQVLDLIEEIEGRCGDCRRVERCSNDIDVRVGNDETNVVEGAKKKKKKQKVTVTVDPQ
jgi:hypothetical protein